ncbi:MAG: DUF1232 domain-containing protein [Dehalococcoidia bacterium]|nr:DUF1232 domain-containing protein [Dehalococcoidia bacterium]
MRALLYLFGQLAALVYFMFHRQVPMWVKQLPWAAFVYLVWPRDLFFDFPPLPGLLDDALIGFLLLKAFFWLARRAARPQRPQDPPDGAVPADFRVIAPPDQSGGGRDAAP